MGSVGSLIVPLLGMTGIAARVMLREDAGGLDGEQGNLRCSGEPIGVGNSTRDAAH